MGLCRGLFLGLFAGLISALLNQDPARESGSAPVPSSLSLLDEARVAARDERVEAERRLRERLARARRGDYRFPED